MTDEAKCPDCGEPLVCLSCLRASQDEAWQEFLEQYPNQRNEILRAGMRREYIGSRGGFIPGHEGEFR